jgi:pimeloyl-ACP methyl ester carboxylesterase
LATFVEQLDSLTTGYERIDLAGFSLGALVAQAFAVAHPSKVRRLVLLGSVFRRTETELQAIRDRVAEVRTGGFLRTVDVAIDRWFSPSFAAAHPDVVARVRATMESNDVRAYADAYAVFAVGDTELAPHVSRIAAPTLTIAGADDLRSTSDMSRALAATVIDGRYEVIPNTRHCFMLEQPATVAALIDGFLDDQRESG